MIDMSGKTPAELRLILSSPAIGEPVKRAARKALKAMAAPKGERVVVLPWRVLCSVNQRTVPVGGRQVLSQKYRDGLAMAAHLAGKQWRGGAHTGPVSVRYDFYPPDNRRRDAENFVKLPGDALIGIAYDDDSQVQHTTIHEHPTDRDNPRVEITVAEIMGEREAA